MSCLHEIGASSSPEATMSLVSEALETPVDETEDTPEDWKRACDALAAAGESTWYACRCGKIAPTSGNIDAICPQCGEMRRLPVRLPRAPWPLFVASLKRARPMDWFAKLGQWMESERLGAVQLQKENGGAYAQHSTAQAAYPSTAMDSGDGATAPKQKTIKKIVCIDGMQILETGEVRGIAWIALPMPRQGALEII